MRWLVNLMEYINLNHADSIVVVSEALYDELINRGITHKKLLINPNGVDPALFDPNSLGKERHAIRAQLNIEQQCIFGFIGTFSIWHGINILGYLIKQLIPIQNNVHFLLIGDGPLLEPLKKELITHGINEKHVTYTGIIAHDQAKSYLAACDIFLSPTQPNPDGSRFFGSPTKLFEYMSLAKPIIASDLEQLSQVLAPAYKITNPTQAYDIPDNTVGILVDPHDKDAFVQAALMLTNLDQQKQTLIGYNARKKICNYYSWTAHVQAIEHFFCQ